MAKAFREVFPTLQLKQEMEEFLDEVEVERVVSTSRKDFLRIYIVTTRLMQKQAVYALEREIKKQLFGHADIAVKIIERFLLSEQYTPEKLYELYADSILSELKEYNQFSANLLKRARVVFPEEYIMRLTLEDTVIARSKTEDITHILKKVFNERCGFGVDLQVDYAEAAPSRARKDAELKLQQEVEAVLRKAEVLHEGEPAPAGQTQAGTQSAPGKPAEPQKRTLPGKRTAQGGSRGAFQPDGGRGFGGRLRRSENPDVAFGRDFEEEAISIEQIEGEMGEVVIRGKIITMDIRALRNGEKSMVLFAVTDFTDTISVKLFVKNDQVDELKEGVAKGRFIKVKGIVNLDKFDRELCIMSVTGIKKIPDFTSVRKDTAPRKRVELHCHTKMSDMDGVADVKDLIKRAIDWGMPAMAVTDHGVVQAFPDANHAVPRDSEFKVIYGVEGYLVDDLRDTVVNEKGQTLEDTYVVFDIETTGLSAIKNKIIEIGAVKVEGGKIKERFSTFVNPRTPIPYEIEKLTSIKDSMVLDAPGIEEVLPEFLEFAAGAVLVAHNAGFDVGFIEKNAADLGIETDFTVVDTVGLSRILLPELSRHKLDNVAKALHISLENHHRAVDDAEATAEIFIKFSKMLKEQGVEGLSGINLMGSRSDKIIKKMPTHHVIILAKNDVGRVNLYRLISLSHINYYHLRPRIPKSVLNKYREGLIVGSACEAGELYQAILDEKPPQEIARIVNFYDYLEIQPLGNNAFMLRSSRINVETQQELIDINKRIVALGEQFKKPVVATCDVHFLEPEDEIYRRIIMTGKGFSDADEQAPLYLRTTEEMLEEFAYLGSDKAEEVVVTNTNLIADMVEKISPIHPDKCPPVIENSDQTLRKICYEKAHEIYGPTLPGIVETRLEKELNSIISNGYAVMYIIAQKLVWKSVEDGYLVGSRGSVGSSLVATMAGITEVNPMPPHYYCKECHYYDFDSAEVKAYAADGKAGCDMADRECPKCGAPLCKEGFDIPFETFLGFDGDKEPDIDLNFSGEYQSKAHKYTEVIFGAGQTFRAGTIGTLADKTAFGYVRGYFEDKGMSKRGCEIMRIAEGCTGVRRTTGQHPGGIIVLPMGMDINSFTPVQHPANDTDTDIVTTHFDYHSIDANLLKLDILGHDDPTMIRMLQDLTDVDPQGIPLDDKQVMSLFRSTEALGVSPSEIGGCPLGSMGIPEFGTDFVIQMLVDTKPGSFSDLIRISGLSHGTDVWLGNAQTLIQDGKATISTAICTRDDIMTYLIHMGVDSSLSFKIMESVRKGKGLQPHMEEAMLAANVPEWYIWSCKKIKYMFPKAHAAAYVMMAWRIAWFKVNYPLAYYAAYFSIRASAFSYGLMCFGKERLEYHIDDYKKRSDELSNKELDTLKDMKIVQEMYARGYEFMPIDLFRAESRHFQIIDGKLMPSLSSIDGMSEKQADAVVEAVKDGEFLSKDDFRTRTKLGKTMVDMLASLELLDGIPESNQLSLFDFA